MEGINENESNKVHDDSVDNENSSFNDINKMEKVQCKFHLEGRCRFGEDCNNYHDPNVKVKGREDIKLKNQKSNSKKQIKNITKIDKTKPKMRTALDVIHRIQWDDALPEELITIGYEDRFTGIQVRTLKNGLKIVALDRTRSMIE